MCVLVYFGAPFPFAAILKLQRVVLVLVLVVVLVVIVLVISCK